MMSLARSVTLLSTRPTPRLMGLGLNPASVAESASVGAVVGEVTGARLGSTISLEDDAGGLFALDGNNIEVAAALDYESATSHNITLRETNAAYSNSPKDTIRAIAVTNVPEVTLGALSLDNDTCAPDDIQGTLVGTITGATAGSTVTLHAQSVANAFQKDGDDIEVGSAAPLSEGTPTITLRETHPDASNSPNDTVIPITVEEVESLGDELNSDSGMSGPTDWTFIVLDGNEPTFPGGVMTFDGVSDVIVQRTAADTLTTGDYRITWENAGSNTGTLSVGGSAMGTDLEGNGTTIGTAASISNQLIQFRVEYGDTAINILSIKKIL